MFRRTPVSSTNKTDRHDITEILLKVTLSTSKQTIIKYCYIQTFFSHKIKYNYVINEINQNPPEIYACQTLQYIDYVLPIDWMLNVNKVYHVFIKSKYMWSHKPNAQKTVHSTYANILKNIYIKVRRLNRLIVI